ncbi:Early nodulin-like protein 1, partial [Cucurbita argyrosperma subsp. sororia]
MAPPTLAGFLALALALLAAMVSSSDAYKFYVGGGDGWVQNPSENFNHWAERNRFQVNDTLYFKYKNGTDSVLVVSKEDYFSCNTKNPVITLKDGESIFKFGHSGPFYFISGDADRCQKGQRLIVVVLALRHKQHLAPSPQAPTPTAQSPENAGSPESGVGFTAPVPAPAKSSAFGGSVSTLSLGVVLVSFFVGFV